MGDKIHDHRRHNPKDAGTQETLCKKPERNRLFVGILISELERHQVFIFMHWKPQKVFTK